MSTFNSRGELDPARAIIVTCLGKKRSGKSKMARLLFDSYPYDRVVIDVNGTDGPHLDSRTGRPVENLSGTVDDLPRRWPEERRHERDPMTLRYVPDAGSATFVEDMDAVMGMAWQTGRVAVLVHEMGLLAQSGRTPPHTRRVLQSNRHRQVTLLACAPRPLTMDPLVIGQSDLVYTFELPNPHDRRRVAETIGWDPADFDAAVHELARHEYLRFDAHEAKPDQGGRDLRLMAFPPLPADVVAEIDRT